MAGGAIPGAIVYAVAWLNAARGRQGWPDFLAWTVSGAVYGALVGVVLYIYLLIPDDDRAKSGKAGGGEALTFTLLAVLRLTAISNLAGN